MSHFNLNRYKSVIRLHVRITPNDREKALGQSYEGRLWDILFMAFITVIRQRSADQASFEVSLFEAEADSLITRAAAP